MSLRWQVVSAGSSRDRIPRGHGFPTLGGRGCRTRGGRVWCVPLPSILVGRGTRFAQGDAWRAEKRYAMHSELGSAYSPGPTSLRLRSGNHVNHTTRFRRYGSAAAWSEGIAKVVSSSGRSYISRELCMCTDYSMPSTGQMTFWNMRSGIAFSQASGDPKCVRCNLVRPYRLTSVSM